MITIERTRSCCKLPHVERETYYAAAIAGGMIASAGTIVLISRDAMGHLDPRIGKVLVACIPFLGSQLLPHFSPKVKAAACCLGAAMGMAIPGAFGISSISFVVGTVIGGIGAGVFADKLKFHPNP